jgi:hypothetical protein
MSFVLPSFQSFKKVSCKCSVLTIYRRLAPFLSYLSTCPELFVGKMKKMHTSMQDVMRFAISPFFKCITILILVPQVLLFYPPQMSDLAHR